MTLPALGTNQFYYFAGYEQCRIVAKVQMLRCLTEKTVKVKVIDIILAGSKAPYKVGDEFSTSWSQLESLS